MYRWKKRKYETNSKKPMRNYLWSLATWQGKIIRAIVLSETPSTWKEIQESTSLNDNQLNKALQDLIDYKTIYRMENDDESQAKYQLYTELWETYSIHY